MTMMNDSEHLQYLLRLKAFGMLQQGAKLLIDGADELSAEQLSLLQQVKAMSDDELGKVEQTLPSNPIPSAADESMLQIQIEAALNGHQLGHFEPVMDRDTGGFQAKCSLCGETVWTGALGYIIGEMDHPCSKTA